MCASKKINLCLIEYLTYNDIKPHHKRKNKMQVIIIYLRERAEEKPNKSIIILIQAIKKNMFK